MSSDIESIKSALAVVPSDDRMTWICIGNALKTHGGDELFQLWDDWSRKSESYDERVARQQWASFRHGRNHIGRVFHEARIRGWRAPEGWERPEPVRRRDDRRQVQEQRAGDARRAALAAAKAADMLSISGLETHPYLERKGFADVRMPVLDGKLLVPMRDVRDGSLTSLQTIDDEGGKRFLPGGRKKGSAFRIGRGRDKWYCEGLATALSVKAALEHIRPPSMWNSCEFVVVFDAFNLVDVARFYRRGYVAADHDLWKCGDATCGHR